MLTRITAVEARLFFREPGVWLLTILLPTIVLVVVGSLFGTEADPALGGRRWIDIFAPSMVVMTLAILGVNSALYLTFYYVGGTLGSVLPGLAWQAWRWPGVVGVCAASLGIGLAADAVLCGAPPRT